MIYSDFIKAESLKILRKTDFIWTLYSCKRCLKIHLGGCGEGSASEGETMSWDPYNRRRDSAPSVVSVLHTCALPIYTGQSCHDADTIYVAPRELFFISGQMEFWVGSGTAVSSDVSVAGASVPCPELPAFALSSALETAGLWPRVTGEGCPLTTDCPPLILRLVLRVHTLGSTFWKFVPTHTDLHVCGAAWVAGIAPGGVWKCLKTVSADMTWCVQWVSRR